MFSLYHRVSSCILESFAARRARIFYTPLNDATPEVSGTVVVQNFADLTGIDYAGPRIVAPHNRPAEDHSVELEFRPLLQGSGDQMGSEAMSNHRDCSATVPGRYIGAFA